jgi:hypothetical protein
MRLTRMNRVLRIERRAVGTITAPAVNSIAMDSRRPVQSMGALFVALGYHARMGIRAASDLLERRFAEFAAVPYQSPVCRRQWEELWKRDAEP